MPDPACPHGSVVCFNEYDLIRKYRCCQCNAVMMCSCDRAIGQQFLPHQLHVVRVGAVEPTQVDAGFVDGICRACRGLPLEPHPKAELYGESSKIRRFYWREIDFKAMTLFGEWAEAQGLDPGEAYFDGRFREEVGRHRDLAVQAIKSLHAKSPKYDMREESAQAILDRCAVEVLSLKALYDSEKTSRKAGVIADSEVVTAEEFALRHFINSGYEVMPLESRPIHALFGTMMWLLIQDPFDEHGRIVGFGDRAAYEADEPGPMIWTRLPDDFGSAEFASRRAAEIAEHLSPEMEADLEWLFDYWQGPSADLRSYLWAHRTEDVNRARTLLRVLPSRAVMEILRYLVGNYWERYLGWPDLLVHRPGEWFLVEVKSSKDRLARDQLRWIQDNASILRFPFKVVKIHRAGSS